MKKCVVLTSLLALAACSTGGGGSSSGGSSSWMGDGHMTPGAVASNKKITNMTSAIAIAEDGSGSVVRSATTHYNGKDYTVYKLDDVHFYAADSTHTDNGYLQMGLDTNGRIDNISMKVGGVGAPAKREGESQRFANPIFEWVPENGDNAEFRMVDAGQTIAQLAAKRDQLIEDHLISENGHWNLINESMDVVTSGKDANGGLRYSDFGRFNPIYHQKYKEIDGLTDDQLNAARRGEDLGRGDSLDKIRSQEDFDAAMLREDYQLFAGGYAILNGEQVETLDPGESATYTGRAIGRVSTSIDSKGTYNYNDRREHFAAFGIEDTGDPDDGHYIAKAFYTDGATLSVNGGETVLYMPFNSDSANDDVFYDVTVTKNGDGTSVVFDPGEATIESQYQLHGADEHVVGNPTMNAGYYGIDNPSEAAGTVHYQTQQVLEGDIDTHNYITRDWEFQAAYGMKKED